MNKYQISKKYSRALINSVEISDVPTVVQEFKAFSQLLEKNRKLKLLFAGQIFSEAEKEKAFDALKPLLKCSAAAEKFLKLMVVQGHLSALNEIIAASIEIYNVREKKATAIVVSSVTLNKKYAERLKGALKAMTGRDVTLENKIDKSLLGGFIVKVGSTIFDSSIKGQLRLLRAELMR